MYLHLGQETTLRKKTVVGIFDLDNCSISKKTRDFLKRSEQAGRVVNVSQELPKSFVVTAQKPTANNPRQGGVYISQLSASTLKKRWREKNITTQD